MDKRIYEELSAVCNLLAEYCEEKTDKKYKTEIRKAHQRHVKKFRQYAQIFKKFKESEGETMKSKTRFEDFECGFCDGDGYITKWGDSKTGKEEFEDFLIEDCIQCDGTGKARIKVIDSRRINKKKAEYRGRT